MELANDFGGRDGLLHSNGKRANSRSARTSPLHYAVVCAIMSDRARVEKRRDRASAVREVGRLRIDKRRRMVSARTLNASASPAGATIK
jgi:hypothetical protein